MWLPFSYQPAQVWEEWEVDPFWYWEEGVHGGAPGKEPGVLGDSQSSSEDEVFASCQQPHAWPF